MARGDAITGHHCPHCHCRLHPNMGVQIWMPFCDRHGSRMAIRVVALQRADEHPQHNKATYYSVPSTVQWPRGTLSPSSKIGLDGLRKPERVGSSSAPRGPWHSNGSQGGSGMLHRRTCIWHSAQVAVGLLRGRHIMLRVRRLCRNSPRTVRQCSTNSDSNRQK